MMRDERYQQVKALIQQGYIKEFSQVFKVIPKSIFHADIGVNYRRMSKMIADLGTISITDIYTMCSVLDIEFMTLLTLIIKEHNRRKTAKKITLDNTNKGKSFK
jgi:hypothetical protein